jgi:hypothetical protein
MARRRHTPEQIVPKLREAALLSEGKYVEEVARHLSGERVDVQPLASSVRRDEGRRVRRLKELETHNRG